MNYIIFIVAVVVFFVDQISKVIIELLLKDNIVNIIGNFFRLTPHNNYGAALGMLSGKTYLLIAFTLIGFIIIYRFMRTFKLNKRNNLAFGLLIGGIFGNLSDRLFLGYVRDFFEFKIFSYNFPIFNIADASIVIAVLLLIFAIIKGEDKK